MDISFLMGLPEMKYHPGITWQETNARVIPYFIGSIKETGKYLRPLDPQQYRDSVVEFLEPQVPITGKKQHLPFEIGAAPQEPIDLANRVIFLARKIAKTTREGNIPSCLANNREVYPQDYLDRTLELLSLFRGSAALEVANGVSSILSADPNHYLTPFLVTEGFPRMTQAYTKRAGNSEQFVQLTLEGLDKVKEHCEWVSEGRPTEAGKVIAARELLDKLRVPIHT